MTILTITQIKKQYKKKMALHPISFQVEAGQCLVLCGGNGAGKSTLLQILAGISDPTNGTVRIDEIDLAGQRLKYVEQIGFMPDEFHAQDMLTVTEFLTFYGLFRNVNEDHIKEMIVTLGLEEQSELKVKYLSKGMRQRLIFGQAALAQPRILILDEPTNGLDPIWIDSFIRILNEIKRNGTIIIFSTHMMDVATEVADFVFFMENGKLVQSLKNDHIDHQAFMQGLLQLYRTEWDG